MEIEIKLFFDVVPFSPAQERAAVALDLCGSINSVSMEPISLCDARQMQKKWQAMRVHNFFRLELLKSFIGINCIFQGNYHEK